MNIYGQVGWRAAAAVNPSQASTLWNSVYAVYNAENNANDALNTYNGTPMGGLTYGVGKVGNAFNFNGTTSYVQLGDVMDVGLSSWSYSFWFKANVDHAEAAFFSKSYSGTGAGRLFAFVKNYTLSITFTPTSTGVITVQTPANSILKNNWYHIVCVLDRNDKIKAYINGVLQTLTTTAGTNNLTSYVATNYNTNNPFRIGCYTSSNNTTPVLFFNGQIDAFNVWNKVLNQTEITELYNSGNGKQYPN
jgi:hypothetical protein